MLCVGLTHPVLPIVSKIVNKATRLKVLIPFLLQKISKGGFVKRAAHEDKALPPSYSRRQVDERPSKSSLPASRQSSGALSRKGSANIASPAATLSRGNSGIWPLCSIIPRLSC